MNKILIVTTIFLSLIVVGCSSNSGSTQSTSPSTTTSPSTSSSSSTGSTSNSSTTATPTVTTGDMTLAELKKFNGQNGNPAYVAVKGVIYDVSNVKEWQNGIHKNGIKAGADLTKMIGDSPHGESVLKNLPVIGKLK